MNKIILFFAISFVMLFAGTVVLAYQAPTANAGPDLYVASGQAIVLQGSGYDSQGAALTYYWNCSGGSLSGATIDQPTFTAPSTSGQSYNCSLTVTNSYGLSASDTMIVYTNGGSNGSFYTQTNTATSTSNYQATLNGYVSGGNSYGTYVWFQYGTTTSYGNTTGQQSLNSFGSFTQNIFNLSANTTYHFRAVAQNNGSIVYGQDMTFYTSGSGYNGSGTLSVTKQVLNISAGNLTWLPSVIAKPGDILSFAITMQATGGQDIHNILLRDILPENLIYKGNVTVNASVNSGANPFLGINVGTISAGGVEIISYQVQVAPLSSFPYGTSTITNNATVTSNEAGTQTAAASVVVNNSNVYGIATTVDTGLTNNPVSDSFFLPILLIIFGSWFYFSGKVYKFSDWIEAKIK